MANKSISEFEYEISEARKKFRTQESNFLDTIKSNSSDENIIQTQLNKLHESAVDFFSLFERSINEYSFLKYFVNRNIRKDKLDQSIGNSETIIKYWELIELIKLKRNNIITPTVTTRAYSTIQSFVKEFDPIEAKALKLKFEKTKLPTYGFTNQRTFIDMTRKQQIKFGAITGLILLLILLAIALIVRCPTNFQNNIFIIVLALAGAAFAAIIPGLIEVKYRQMITATGALAVFVIIFFMKPTQLSNYTNCPNENNISGTIYFGNTPAENIDISFPKQKKSTRSDNFGGFKLLLDFTSIEDNLSIYVKNKELSLDTIYTFEKSKLSKSLDIKIKKHCVKCTQKDSTGTIVNVKEKCSANPKLITDYINGFKKASIEQGRTFEYIRE